MKKTLVYFSVFILTIFIIPSFTFASWWNPSTWQKEPEVQIVEKVVEKPIEIIIEKPIEKIVTKTITVDNPEHLKQIAELQDKLVKANTEIENLNKQISNQAKYMKIGLSNIKSECDEGYSKLSDLCMEKMQSLVNQCNSYNSYTPVHISSPSLTSDQIQTILRASCKGVWNAETSVCYQY